eukprot:8896549-Pyramimonas_sp.AAC.1
MVILMISEALTKVETVYEEARPQGTTHYPTGNQGEGGRRLTSGNGKGRRGNPKDANGEATERDICQSTLHVRRECPQGDGGGRCPS